MSSDAITIPHDLGRDHAKRRVEQGVAKLSDKIGDHLSQIEATWTSPYTAKYVATALGAEATFDVAVNDASVEISMRLPLVIRPFRGKLVEFVKKHGPAFFARPE